MDVLIIIKDLIILKQYFNLVYNKETDEDIKHQYTLIVLIKVSLSVVARPSKCLEITSSNELGADADDDGTIFLNSTIGHLSRMSLIIWKVK